MDLDELLDSYEKRTGSSISRAQVRRYLREGLLTQPPAGELFGEEHLERLQMIEHLRSRYGMALSDISGLFGVVIDGSAAEAAGGREEGKQPVDRRERIIENASGLFAAKGYHGTTVDEIVQATGIAKGTFYIYFNSKEELLVEVIKRLIDGTLERIDSQLVERKGRDFIASIEMKGGEFLQLYMENKELLYMLLGETVGNPRLMDQLKDVYEKLADTVEEDLRTGVREGRIYPYADLRILAHALVGMGQTVAFMLSVNEDFDLEKARETVHQLMQRALSLPSP